MFYRQVHHASSTTNSLLGLTRMTRDHAPSSSWIPLLQFLPLRTCPELLDWLTSVEHDTPSHPCQCLTKKQQVIHHRVWVWSLRLPLSATCRSSVTGFTLVMTLARTEPSTVVYSVCSWNGRCGFPSIIRGGVDATSSPAVSYTNTMQNECAVCQSSLLHRVTLAITLT